jgi:transcriptional regulator with XRE-family HTH domain
MAQTEGNSGIGDRIRAARERTGLTQAALALKVGVTRSAVAQWETGRAGQVGAHLAQIAAVLGVGIEHLMLGGSERMLAREFGAQALTGDEMAMLRLYRACSADDRAILQRMARSLSTENKNI